MPLGLLYEIYCSLKIIKQIEKNNKAKMEIKIRKKSQAHTCNPSYSGGRDQEDCGLNSS
jgi:hypothetical protein